MQRFCYIGSAVIDDDRLRLLNCVESQLFILCHLLYIGCQIARIQADIDKSRHHGVDLRKHLASGCLFHHLIGNIDRFLFIRFGSCHRAVTLILAEIRAV